jgi:hypothetical protein
MPALAVLGNAAVPGPPAGRGHGVAWDRPLFVLAAAGWSRRPGPCVSGAPACWERTSASIAATCVSRAGSSTWRLGRRPAAWSRSFCARAMSRRASRRRAVTRTVLGRLVSPGLDEGGQVALTYPAALRPEQDRGQRPGADGLVHPGSAPAEPLARLRDREQPVRAWLVGHWKGTPLQPQPSPDQAGYVVQRVGEPLAYEASNKCTILAMRAQRALGVREVKIRCARCAPDMGARTPILAVAERDSSDPDRWQLTRLPRLSRPLAGELGTLDAPSPRTIPVPVAGFPRPNDLPRHRSVKLTCRRCGPRPPARVRTLIELAAQAAAEGRRVVYH